MNACYICHEPKNVRCCHNCHKDASKCETEHKCGENCPEHEPMTNADRIRSTSDEELGVVLVGTQANMVEKALETYGIDFGFSEEDIKNIVDEFVEWLQQPWEDDNGEN